MQLLDQGHHSYISTGFGGKHFTPFKVRNLRVTYYIIYIYVCIDYISILAANGTKTKALIRIHVVYIYYIQNGTLQSCCSSFLQFHEEIILVLLNFKPTQIILPPYQLCHHTSTNISHSKCTHIQTPIYNNMCEHMCHSI